MELNALHPATPDPERERDACFLSHPSLSLLILHAVHIRNARQGSSEETVSQRG